MLESCQETIDKLGSQLGERKERRKQLASELELLREDLKAEKVVLDSLVCPALVVGLPAGASCLWMLHETCPGAPQTHCLACLDAFAQPSDFQTFGGRFSIQLLSWRALSLTREFTFVSMNLIPNQ